MMNKKIDCGVIIPISESENYTAGHWQNVKEIIIEAIESVTDYKIKAKLVWENESVNIIRKSIVNSIYQSDLIICDVSSMNPNVMFELGLRFAFDKPAIIIIDNETKINFDTGHIQHLIYDKNLTYHNIKELKKEIHKKIIGILKEKDNNKNYSPFLKDWGILYKSSIQSEDLNSADQLIDILSNVQNDVTFLRKKYSINSTFFKIDPDYIEYLINKATNSWCLKKKVDANAELLNDSEFVNYIETEIDSSRFFDTPDDCRDTLAVVLSSIIGGSNE